MLCLFFQDKNNYWKKTKKQKYGKDKAKLYIYIYIIIYKLYIYINNTKDRDKLKEFFHSLVCSPKCPQHQGWIWSWWKPGLQKWLQISHMSGRHSCWSHDCSLQGCAFSGGWNGKSQDYNFRCLTKKYRCSKYRCLSCTKYQPPMCKLFTIIFNRYNIIFH